MSFVSWRQDSVLPMASQESSPQTSAWAPHCLLHPLLGWVRCSIRPLLGWATCTFKDRGRREGKGQSMALLSQPLVRLLERCLYRTTARAHRWWKGGSCQPLPDFSQLHGVWRHARSHDFSYHPLAGIFISSETPKEREPMKSFRVVRSQSQISTDSRRSLSEGFNLL